MPGDVGGRRLGARRRCGGRRLVPGGGGGRRLVPGGGGGRRLVPGGSGGRRRDARRWWRLEVGARQWWSLRLVPGGDEAGGVVSGEEVEEEEAGDVQEV